MSNKHRNTSLDKRLKDKASKRVENDANELFKKLPKSKQKEINDMNRVKTVGKLGTVTMDDRRERRRKEASMKAIKDFNDGRY